jgi:aminoglycoside 2'-N-acetyltransferase I
VMEIDGQPKSPTGMEPLEIQIVDAYSRADRDELAEGDEDPSRTHDYQLQWRPTEKHVLIVEGGQTACHVGLLKQLVEVNGEGVYVAGLGGVLTRAGCRGRGYAQKAMQTAETFARSEMGVKFIVLFCRPALESWYEGLGWRKIPGQVWVQQEREDVLLPIAAMVRCLENDPWPQGEVRLGSSPW